MIGPQVTEHLLLRQNGTTILPLSLLTTNIKKEAKTITAILDYIIHTGLTTSMKKTMRFLFVSQSKTV